MDTDSSRIRYPNDGQCDNMQVHNIIYAHTSMHTDGKCVC